MINQKWEFPIYSFYDVNGMEHHLERMAAKGWMLDRLGPYGWHYVRCEPKKVHFTVTYYPKASAFDPEPTEGQQTFEEFCAYSGWHLVGSNAKLMIFANEREEPVPIHTDPCTELEVMEKIGKQMAGSWLVLMAFMAMNLVMGTKQLLDHPITYLSSNFNLGFGVVEILLGIYLALDLYGWFHWRKKARKAVEREDNLPETKGHEWLIGFTFVLTGLVILITLLSGSQGGLRFALLFHLVGLVVLCYGVNAIRLWLKKKHASKEKNMVITLAADLILAIALTGGLIWVTLQFRGTEGGKKLEPAVSAEELTGIPQPGAPKDIQARASFFLTKTHVWDMPSVEVPRDQVRALSYELVEIHFAPVYDVCFREFYHHYDHYGDHNEDYDENAPFYIYEPVDPTLWNAERVWQLRAYGEWKSTYLVCWENRILEFEADWDMTAQEISLAAERLGPQAEA